jgi:phenylacetate-CoA ligase
VKFPWRELLYESWQLGPWVVESYLEILRHQRMAARTVRRIQERRLARVIRKARRDIPYYRSARSERSESSRIDAFTDLGRFPIIDRSIVADHWTEFRTRGRTRYAPRSRRTGGTFGRPLQVLLDRRTRALRMAYDLVRMQWAGWTTGDRTAVLTTPLGYFGGGEIDFDTLYAIDLPRKTLLLNPGHLDEQRLRDLSRLVGEYRPDSLRGFPSTLVLLARSLASEKIKVRPRSVMTGGELILDWQRRFLEDAFGCTVFDRYGMWESVAAASQCEQGSYHVLPNLGYVEILRNGRPCGPGEAGELVGTHLVNHSMPLIRYNMHDVVAWTGQLCPCGRGTPTLSIIGGRGRDLLVTRSGYAVVPAGLLTRIVPSLPIEKLQFYQEKKGEVLVRIVRGRGCTPEHTRILRDEIGRLLGDAVTVSWEYVEDIPRTSAGKYQFVISHVPLEL